MKLTRLQLCYLNAFINQYLPNQTSNPKMEQVQKKVVLELLKLDEAQDKIIKARDAVKSVPILEKEIIKLRSMKPYNHYPESDN